MGHKLIIKLSSIKKTLDLPHYTVAYLTSGTLQNKKEESQRILSRLINERPFILEIKYQFLCLLENEREIVLSQFLNEIDKTGLKYKHKKTLVDKKNIMNLFWFSEKTKKIEALEIMAFVPAEVWKKSDFYNKIPVYGVRYYIPFENQISEETFDNLFYGNLSEEEILSKFEYIVFDSCLMGQMGINSGKRSLDEVKQLLLN